MLPFCVSILTVALMSDGSVTSMSPFSVLKRHRFVGRDPVQVDVDLRHHLIVRERVHASEPTVC